ncbi:MAG: choice-of-anchor L domain-containing protein [Flavobacteriales bacterium]|nr:choice-of-anchor L domain-containing protein [Flavobacteriales bacterium]
MMRRRCAHISLTTALLTALGWNAPAHAQLVINQTQAPTTLVQTVLMGSGVFASNITFNGDPGNVVAPLFTTLGQIGRFNGSNTNLGLNSGVFLCTNNAATHLPGPNNQLMELGGGLGGGGFWTSPDLDLSQLTGWPNWQVSGGGNIGNKSVLEFDFVPSNDLLSVRYVFSSEEYERWACSEYNDAFGFFISGPGIPTNINGPFTNNAMNLAFVPGSLSRVSINTVNSGTMDANNANGPWTDPFAPCFAADPNWQSNSIYYRYNGGQWPFPQPPGGVAQLEAPYNTDPYYIQHNGMTVVLTASAAVQCGQTYHIKLAVGNTSDNWFPSAVWLEQGSFTSTDRFDLTVDPGPNVEYNATDTTFIESDCDSVYLRFHRLGGFYLDEWLQISVGGTATNGVDVLPMLIDSVHFNQLDSFAIVPIAVPVDADGLEDLVINLITCNGTRIRTYTFPIDQGPPLTVDLADTVLSCPAQVTLAPTVTGGGGNPAEYTYLWNTGETTPSISPMVLQTTQYWVTVKDCWSLGATDSAWVTIPAYVPMVLTLPPDTAIPCLGNADLEAQVANGTGGYSYEWALGGQVVGTDSVLNVPAAQPPVYYVITVTDLCGAEVTDSVLVSQAPPTPLVLTMPQDTAIPCLGQAELIPVVSGGGGTLQYTWMNGGSTVGTGPTLIVPAAVHEIYTLAVSDQCGQTVQGQVVVSTGPTPPLQLVAEGDTVMCAGQPMVLSVISVAGGGGAYSYSWSPGGSGNSNEADLHVSVNDDSWFTITVTDQCGNTTDTTVLAMVEDFAPLSIAVPNDTVVCPGEVVPLWVTIQGGAGGYQVNWPGLGTGPQINWTADHQGRNILVEVTDACGNLATAAVMASTFPAGVSIDAEEIVEGTWQFHGTTVPATGNSVEWDFGDGATASGNLHVTHSYQDYDPHWVVLQIITPDGCTASDSVQTRPPAATIYFPNSFTPDGDGHNDTFGGEGRLVERYELLVFDRWGTVIFESHDMNHRWDGRAGGEEPVTGIYPFRYRVEGLQMPLHQGFGHITLLK